MGMFGKKQEPITYQFIARPDSAKELLFYKWPDSKVKFLSMVTVQPDEQALFVDKGILRGYVEPGQHRLDGPGIPLIQNKVDELTGGRLLLGELYFISTREFANQQFAGTMGQVKDPDTDMMVGMQVFGGYSFKAIDPGKLLLHLLGTRHPLDNNEVKTLVSEHLLYVTRALVNRHLTEDGWPVLTITSGAHNLDIERDIVPAVNERVAAYGLELTKIQDFSVSIDRADAMALKELYQRKARTKLAGDDSYQRMAEAEALLGAAEGLRSGGSGGGGGMSSASDFAGIGIGLGVGMRVAEQIVGGSFSRDDKRAKTADPVTSTPDNQVTCPACGATVHAGAFCSACAASLAPPTAAGDASVAE